MFLIKIYQVIYFHQAEIIYLKMVYLSRVISQNFSVEQITNM